MTRKPYYQDYVNHMMRHYLKWLETNEASRDTAGELNLAACQKTIGYHGMRQQFLVLEIYRSNADTGTATFEGNVHRVAFEEKMEERDLWALWNAFSKVLAQERGLI